MKKNKILPNLNKDNLTTPGSLSQGVIKFYNRLDLVILLQAACPNLLLRNRIVPIMWFFMK